MVSVCFFPVECCIKLHLKHRCIFGKKIFYRVFPLLSRFFLNTIKDTCKNIRKRFFSHKRSQEECFIVDIVKIFENFQEISF